MIKLIEKTQSTASLYVPKDDLPSIKNLVSVSTGKNCSFYADKKGSIVAYQLIVSLDILDKIQKLVGIEGHKASKSTKIMSSLDMYDCPETESIS